MVAKILSEKKANGDCVRLSAQVLVAPSVFDGFADAKNVLCGNRGIQRNGVPVRKSISRFRGDARFVRVAAD